MTMTILNKQISEEDARKVAEKCILDKYPYANVTFEKAELRTNDTQQLYRFAGYSRLAKWPAAITEKSMCEIWIDTQSADIVGCHGF